MGRVSREVASPSRTLGSRPSKESRQDDQISVPSGCPRPCADVLAARGIETPFQIQTLVIPEALRGGDVLAKSPTGSGKTLAFAIPIVERLDPTAQPPRARSSSSRRASSRRR